LFGIFGIDRPFFIDMRLLSPRSMVDLGGFKRPAIEHVLRECLARSLQAIPMLSLTDDVNVRRHFENSLGFGRGASIRVEFLNALSSTGRTLDQELERRLDELDLPYARVDLFLDLGQIPQEPGYTPADIARRLGQLGDLTRWRTVMLGGTVIPANLQGMPEYTVRELMRREMELWRELGVIRQTRWPSFVDYLIQNPRPPVANAIGMKANIRYSTRERVVIVRGAALSRDARQYSRLAKMLTARPDFDGPSAGWGDQQIEACAKGLTIPRLAQEWRAIGTARHLEITTTALAEREVA